MEISSKFVGMPLKDHQTIVNWRDTMNYAAAVNDNNAYYFDDEREGGLIAPPMYSVAVTWPILEKLWEYLDVDDFPTEILATQVHYSEHLEFHAPLKPGDELRIKGKIAAILPHRAGTHLVIRFDALDEKGGPVFTEHIGGMMRGVKCSDAGQGAASLPKVPAPPAASAPVWEQVIKIDPLRPYVYDGCANIVFPIHTSPKFAHQVGLPGIILQGTATLALAARELINRNAKGNPTKLQSLHCRFADMVLPGTDIQVQLLSFRERKAHTDLFFSVLNGEGRTAIRHGYAKVDILA